LALAGFLAGYTGLTREAYALDLRQCASWCQQRHIRLFRARRADIECFARDLEAHGQAWATITRRLCTITKPVGPHTLGQSPSPRPGTRGSRCGVPRKPPRTLPPPPPWGRPRGSLNRHATDIVAAYLAGAAR